MAVPFTKLPHELAGSICRFLSVEDLFSLRLVNMYSSKIATTELVKRPEVLSSLESIVVLYTRDGLGVLKGLCQIPEFRKHVKKIAFVIAKVDRLESDSPPTRRPIAASQLLEEQNLFLESVDLRNMVHEILELIKDDHQLSSISVGFVPPSMKPASLPCGSQPLCAELRKLHYEHDYRKPYFEKGVCVQEYLHAFRFLFEALQAINFDKKIVGVQVIVDTESPEVVKKDDWALLEHPCLARLELRHVDRRVKVLSNTRRPAQPEPADATILFTEEAVDACFTSMHELEELKITSQHEPCDLSKFIYKPIQPCTMCNLLSRSLNHGIFPNLKRVEFRNHVNSSDQFLQFFATHARQLQYITLADIGLCKGSWKDILNIFTSMPLVPQLNELHLAFLFEKCCPPARENPFGIPFGRVSVSNNASVKGRDEIERFLEQVMKDYRTSQKHLVSGSRSQKDSLSLLRLSSISSPDPNTWGVVVFPGTWN